MKGDVETHPGYPSVPVSLELFVLVYQSAVCKGPLLGDAFKLGWNFCYGILF